LFRRCDREFFDPKVPAEGGQVVARKHSGRQTGNSFVEQAGFLLADSSAAAQPVVARKMIRMLLTKAAAIFAV
jgi:hypothetical protein